MVNLSETSTLDEGPLSIEELEGALDDIRRAMPGYADKQLTPQKAVELLVRLRGLEGEEREVLLLALGMSQQAYDQLYALRDDLKHHTQIDVDAKKSKGDNKKKKKTSKKSRIDGGDQIVISGLEPTSREVLATITGKHADVKQRVATLLAETPADAVDAIPALVSETAKTKDLALGEIYARHGLAPDVFFAWNKIGGDEAKANGLLERTPPDAVPKVKDAIDFFGATMDGHYAMIQQTTGITRGLLIRWTVLLNESPTALQDMAEKRKREERIRDAEEAAQFAKMMPLSVQDRPDGFTTSRYPGAPAQRPSMLPAASTKYVKLPPN